MPRVIASTSAQDIIDWRIKHNATQAEAAQALGVHMRTIQSWEAGKNEAPFYLWWALLDGNANQLLQWHREQKSSDQAEKPIAKPTTTD